MNGKVIGNCRGLIKAFAALAVAAGFACLAGPARAQEVVEEAREAVEDFNPRRVELSVGAGSMAYIAQESPATAFALDARFGYPVLPLVDLEGAVLGAISQSVDDNSATIPFITEAGVKVNTNNYGPISLFGAAGLGYGAYLGSEELQDGATMTVPIGGGLEWKGRNLTLEPRFTYRPVFGDELGDEEADADSWTAVLDVQLPFL